MPDMKAKDRISDDVQYIKYSRYPLRMLIPSILALLCISLVIFFIIIPKVGYELRNSRKASMEMIIDIALSVTGEYYEKMLDGVLTEEDAKKQALNAVSDLSYGKSSQHYYYVMSAEGYFVAHGTHPELIGRHIDDVVDIGDELVMDILKANIPSSKSVFLEYDWYEYSPEEKWKPKIACIKKFEPWEWYIATGVFQSDFEMQSVKTETYLFVVAVILVSVIFLLIILVIKERSEAEQNRKEIESALRNIKTRFTGIAKLLPQIIYEINEQGIATFVNENTYKITGYSEADFEKGFAAVDLLIPEDRKRAADNIAGLLQGQEIGTNEYMAIRSDGSTFPVLSHAAAVTHDDGSKSVCGVLFDISEHKEMEDALRTSEEMFRSFVESAVDIVFTLSTDGTFNYVSPKSKEQLGFEPQELIGKSFESFIHFEDTARVEEILSSLLSGQVRQASTEYRVTDKDNNLHWQTTKASVLLNDDGQVKCILGIARDSTQSKHQDEMIVKAQRMESIGRLAGGVAHDFNNILTGIIGYCDLVKESLEEDSPIQDDMRQIEKAANRAAELTSRLLAFSRTQTNQPVSVNLNKVMMNIRKLLQRLIGDNIDLVLNLDDSLEKILADPEQMEQVIMNLVLNSRDAMPNGGEVYVVTENVEISENQAIEYGSSVLAQGRYVKLRVSDKGCGMPKEILEHVFEPFFTTKDVGKGTGLGLAAVYGIVKQHNGFIEIFNNADVGMTVCVYLPPLEIQK